MNDSKKTLIDFTPHEFTTYQDSKAWKFRDVKVIREVDGTVEGFPGKHKHVYTWWELENGYAVGWNENPAIGWSFPVIGKLRKK